MRNPKIGCVKAQRRRIVVGVAARSKGQSLEIDAAAVGGIAVVGENVDVVQHVSVVVDHPDIFAVLDSDKEYVMGDIVHDGLRIRDHRGQQDVPDNLRTAAVHLDDLRVSDIGAVGDIQMAVDRVK